MRFVFVIKIFPDNECSKKKIILIYTYFKHITIPLSTPLLALKLDWFAEAPGADWPLLFKEFTRLQKLSGLFVPFNTRSFECLRI